MMGEANSADVWIDLHGCQLVSWMVEGQRVLLGPDDFAPQDLRCWPFVKRVVLDAAAQYKVQLAKAESDL